MKKGVHVEYRKEYEVTTVRDVLKLLLQGAATSKIAATHMNSESSRSHGVFTCVIESRWEKDSMAHIRFGSLLAHSTVRSHIAKKGGAFGVKCGSPEWGFAASYGDGYGLHSGAFDKGPLYGMSSGSWGAFEKSRIERR